MSIVAVTDFGDASLDIEEKILEPLGCTLTRTTKGKEKDREALKAVVRDADCVITQFSPVDAEVIAAMQKCKVIVRYGIGVDNVDLAAAAAKKIPVCNVPDYCTNEVADHALAMILEMTRRIAQTAAVLRAGRWTLGVPIEQMRALSDMTVGIVAFGRIGREVAQRLKPFHCRILVADPMVQPAQIKKEGFTPVTLDELFSQSDLVTLHCPSTAETRQMVNARTLGLMKRGSLLVNVSRGTLVNTDDLVAALTSGALSGAAMDVTDPEPLPPDHPLLKMDNVLVNPHCASGSPSAGPKLRTSVANIVATVIKGKKPPNIVNGVSV
jgi:D-3-phosphoglycerate dehydrogenase / 2-oxoglutarate reductase